MDIYQLLKNMTFREKLAQLTQLDGSFHIAQEDGQPTGPLFAMNITEEDVAQSGTVLGAFGAALTRDIQDKHLQNDRHHIPVLFMMDVIHGFRTIYPIPLAMGCTWDPELACRTAAMAAREAAASGIHVNFSPMADLVRDARWGRVMESTGEDPYINALFAAAFVRGYQGEDLKDEEHLAACVKHLAAYGAAESGRDYNAVELGGYALREFYLPAYRAAIDAGAAMVMSSFNALNGVPSTMNIWLLRDLLRGEWGFDGPVISDWGAVQELVLHGVAESGREAAEKALKAGVDIEMTTSNYLQYGETLREEGRLDETIVDEAVLRILRLKERMGLFEDPYHGASPEKEREVQGCAAHRELAREAAARSLVLLKNRDSLLPLSSDKRVAVIGPYGEARHLLGGWSCVGREEETISLREGILSKMPAASVSFAQGAGFDPQEEPDMEAIRRAVEAADVVLLAVGEHPDMSGEAASRAFIELPESQARLADAVLALGKPTVVVLFNGRPLDIRRLSERADAILEAWFPGNEGGSAVADVLFGDRLPEGRLTMSFPYTVGQVPVYYNGFSTGRPIDREWSDQRYLSRYIDIPNAPLYPFGFGLHYTTVTYGKPVLSAPSMTEELAACISVTNSGNRPAVETVQLYIRDVCGSVVRPVRELKGFQKVRLAPGETAKIRFVITRDMLAFTHADGARYAEPGDFLAGVGSNAADVQEMPFTLV